MKKLILFMMIWLLCLAGSAMAVQQVTEDYGPVVEQITERAERAVANYNPAEGVMVGNEFSRLYFDVFETAGMEFTLGLKDNAFMLEIESGFSQITSQAMRGAPKEDIEKSWAELKKNLDYAVEHYSNSDGTGFWGQVVQSFFILFREGMEAMLVVAALVAYLRRSGFPDKIKVIWYGVGLALVASVGMAWLLGVLISASGASQEALEGGTMLLAAVVLIYVSYWLTAKRSADRWQAFIKDQMDEALSKGSLLALGFIAFLAVFREGAETILFYQALMGGTTANHQAIWVGMAIAAGGLLVIYLLVRVLSVRLPYGMFFAATAVLLFGMAFVFVGQGIMELQVSGLIPTNRIDGLPMITWLGIFPTFETLVGQLIVLAMLPIGWLVMKFKSNKDVPQPVAG